MVGWLTVKDKTCVTYGSHVNQDSTPLQSAHAPRSSSERAHDTYLTITQHRVDPRAKQRSENPTPGATTMCESPGVARGDGQAWN